MRDRDEVEAMPYSRPLIKIAMTPIFRRVGSCSLETAMIGRIRMYRSMARPITAWGIDSGSAPCPLKAASAHDWPDRGVEKVKFATKTAR